MFVRSPVQFYILRFLLGVAEAGFFPECLIIFPMVSAGAARPGDEPLLFLRSARSTIMGAASPPLLALHGHSGLAAGSGCSWSKACPRRGSASRFSCSCPICRPGSAGSPRSKAAGSSASSTPIPRGCRRPGSTSLARSSCRIRPPRRFGLARHAVDRRDGDLRLSGPLILKQAGFSSGEIGTLVAIGGVLGALRNARDRLYFRSPRRAIHDDVDQHHTDGPCIRADRDGDARPRVSRSAYLLYAASWGSVTLSQVSAWPDCLHGRVLALAARHQHLVAARRIPDADLWGRLADATGSFHAGAVVLTSRQPSRSCSPPNWPITSGGRRAASAACRD